MCCCTGTATRASLLASRTGQRHDDAPHLGFPPVNKGRLLSRPPRFDMARTAAEQCAQDGGIQPGPQVMRHQRPCTGGDGETLFFCKGCLSACLPAAACESGPTSNRPYSTPCLSRVANQRCWRVVFTTTVSATILVERRRREIAHSLTSILALAFGGLQSQSFACCYKTA